MSDNTPNNPGENPRPAENGSSADRGSGDGFGQNVGSGFEHNTGRGFGNSAGQGGPNNSGRGFPNSTGDLGARLNTIAGKLRYLRRSRNDKVFGGVAGGIAEVLGVETVVVRIAIVVLSVMTGVGFFAYLIAWALIAKAPEGRSFASASTHRDSNNRVGQSSHQSFHDVDAQGGFQGNPKKMESRQLMAVAIVSIGVLSLFNRLGINLNGDVLWPLALIGIGSAVLFSKSSKGHGEPPDSSDGVSRGGSGPGGGWNDGRNVPEAGFGGGLGSGAGSGGAIWPNSGDTREAPSWPGPQAQMASETNAVVDPSGPTSKGFRQGFVSPGPWPNAADPTDSPAAVTPLKPYPAPANPQGISGTYPSNAPTDTPANARPTPEDLLNQARREVDALSAHESWLENPIGSSPQPVRTRIDLPRSKRFSHTVMGTTLVLGGLFAIAVRSDWITVGSGIDNLLAFALIGVGAVLFFGAWYGRPFGFLNVGAVLFALLAGASFVGAKWGDGVGQRTYQPKSLRDLQSEYRLGAGTLSLDLSRVNFAGQTRVIDANIGAGAIAIEVPAATSVVVNSISKGGEITLFGETNSQSRRQFRFGNAPSDAKPQLTLNVRAGVGAIEVAQAGRLLKLTDLKSGSLSFNYGSDDGVSSNQVDRNNDTTAVDARQTNPSAPGAKAIGSLTATRSGTAVMA